jgi:FkbM family methyltransferase
MTIQKLWEKCILDQADFYKRRRPVCRIEDSFTWGIALNSPVKQLIRETTKLALIKAGLYKKKQAMDWFYENKNILWESRMIFEDFKSRIAFDAAILLKLSGYSRYFYPNIDFRNHLEILKKEIFKSNEFPDNYLGEKLYTFNCKINTGVSNIIIQLVASGNWVSFQNSYSQYLAEFDGVSFIPKTGETILDCGCCIGEVSILFGAFVGNTGNVHMFDPVPMHIRFAKYQTLLNPEMSHIFNFAQFAVDEVSNTSKQIYDDRDSISPAGIAVNNFSSISIDDYCLQNKLKEVSYIKMDIEGAECQALKGAKSILAQRKPKLAISAYHKDDDLWKIPSLIKELNPNYKLYFGHHSPVLAESVIYAA